MSSIPRPANLRVSFRAFHQSAHTAGKSCRLSLKFSTSVLHSGGSPELCWPNKRKEITVLVGRSNFANFSIWWLSLKELEPWLRLKKSVRNHFCGRDLYSPKRKWNVRSGAFSYQSLFHVHTFYKIPSFPLKDRFASVRIFFGEVENGRI